MRLALVRQRELANILALLAAPIALGLFLLTMPRWLGGTMAFLSLWLFFYGLVLFRRLPALDGATAEAIDEPGVIRPFDDVPLYIRPNDIMDSEDLDELIREQQERRLREPGD